MVRDASADAFVAYIDGVTEFTTASAGSNLVFDAAGLFRIGSDYRCGTPIVFNGDIDELAVYDRALTPTEIAEHYQSAAGLAPQMFESPFNLGDLQPGNAGDGSLGFSSALGPFFDLGHINGDGYDDMALNGSGIVFGRAAGLPAEFDSSLINGTDGLAVTGGTSLHAAGDFNGDGFDNVVVSASSAVYVVYGRAVLPATLDPSALTPAEGLVLTASVSLEGTRDFTGVGDVNGDGYADAAITKNMVSQAYVVFGRAEAPSAIDVDTLDGTNGFRLDPDVGGDYRLVGGAGDVNGDGYGDLLVEAVIGAGGVNDPAKGYVVCGSDAPFLPLVDPTALDGINGFRADGIANELAGTSVAGGGDINGAGVTDLLIGAPGKALPLVGDGAAFVLYGKTSGFASAVSLAG